MLWNLSYEKQRKQELKYASYLFLSFTISYLKFYNIKVKIYFKLIISRPSTLILFCKELKYVSNDV